MKKYDHEALTRELFSFIEQSPCSFYAIDNLSKMLTKQGYIRLHERDAWELTEGGKYFVTRNGSSLIAFRYKSSFAGFQIAAAHSDSPSFKIKDKGELGGDFLRLNTEKYGGMICASWLDRPLSVAGRIVIEGENGIETRLVNIDRDLLLIPNVAIHMNRAANDGMKYNPAVDTLPLLGEHMEKGALLMLIAKEAGVDADKIVGDDLYLYARQKGCVWGAERQFICCRALDDLQCAFACTKGFLAAKKGAGLPVLAIFDNEEVGSSTRQGAASTFLYDTLARVCGDMQSLHAALAGSFLLSCDNAHAVHPNHPEYADPENKVFMNKGVVLKFNAAQRYTTDGIAEAYVRHLCRQKDVPLQSYANRSDIGGGSTLGNIAVTKVSVPSADVGLAQLAMHSAIESAGILDTAAMVELNRALFEDAFAQTAKGCTQN